MKRLLLVTVLVALILVAFALTRPPESKEVKIVPFSSEEDFKEYISSCTSSYEGSMSLGIAVGRAEIASTQGMTIDKGGTGNVYGGGAGEVYRHSTTNVQVEGIDEPDIVKTDGKNIYMVSRIYRLEKGVGGITAVSAYPPDNMSVRFRINDYGKLLLHGNSLVVLKDYEVRAYSVETGKELWKAELNGSLVDARLYNGKLFIVVRDNVFYPKPCPIRPVRVGDRVYTVECGSVYHPTVPVVVDSTYTVMVFNPSTGKIEKIASFVGSTGSTVVYMSRNAVYITYTSFIDPARLAYMFMKENSDLFPDWVLRKVEKLMDYDISNRAKSVEISVIVERYMSSLGKEERLRLENEYWNRWTEFHKKHARDIEQTYIAKFNLDLRAEGLGKVPGRLLNQFSLDEWAGYLRVATTVGGGENDVYVLDSELNIVGAIQGFGLDERIYAVRFVGDRGYIVTFRQTDPFFVIDLSDPKNPKIAGKLKIPGFSSYLHPINDTLVLGIGREGEWVKISLFDVSDPENPEEVDRYILKEYWSAVLNTHHAFLLDRDHGIFFLPAGNGGYVFTYLGGLKLIKAVSGMAERAVYINDYLYIIGPERIVAYDENSWEKAGEIEIS